MWRSYLNRALLLVAVFLGLVSLGAQFGIFSWVLPAIYAGVGLMTFAAYGVDKARAQRDLWRFPEANLHLLELLGGWPGGLIGQHYFRHKRRKGSFMAMFWLIVLLHLGALGWYANTQAQWF